MKKSARILVADDELDLLWALQHSLVDDGFEVITAGNGVEALSQVYKHNPNLLILDVNMPELTGHEVCRRLRRDSRYASIPIILLTVESRVEDRVTGLDGGCDDYVVKPFDLRELKARVRALLRRCKTASPVSGWTDIKAGPLELDAKRRTLRCNGQAVQLTPIEYSLLRCLMSKPGEVVSVEQLLEAVWGYDRASASPNLIRWHIGNLRRKVEPDPSHPRILRTQSHFGYLLSAEDDSEEP